MQLKLRIMWCTSLQIKERKTHLFFVFDLKMYRKIRICVMIKNTHKAYCDYWGACVQWMDFKTLNIIPSIYTVIKTACEKSRNGIYVIKINTLSPYHFGGSPVEFILHMGPGLTCYATEWKDMILDSVAVWKHIFTTNHIQESFCHTLEEK